MRYIVFFIFILTLFQSCSDYEVTNKYKKDKLLYIQAIENYNQVYDLIWENDEKIEIWDTKKKQQIEFHLSECLKASNSINNDFMDYLHPELMLAFRNNFIAGVSAWQRIIKQSNSINKSELEEIHKVQISALWDFMDKHYEQINKNYTTIKVKDKKFKLIRLIITLGLLGIVFSGLFFVGVSGIFISSINDGLSGLVKIFIIILSSLFTIYLLIIWPATIAFSVRYYLSFPFVKFSWLYYIVGFMGVSSVLSTNSGMGDTKASGVADLFLIICAIQYVCYCIWPNILELNLFSWVGKTVYY